MMTEKGVVAVKETGKGVQSLISINQDHPIVQTFSPLLLAAEDCKDKVAHIEDALKPVSMCCVHRNLQFTMWFYPHNLISQQLWYIEGENGPCP
jgi:hypothetical protein